MPVNTLTTSPTAVNPPSFITAIQSISNTTRPTSGFYISPARTPVSYTTTASLFRAYAAWLAIDLSYQSFEFELANLPGKYAPIKGGEILLAYWDHGVESGQGEPGGCVALRDITSVAEAWEKDNGTGGIAQLDRGERGNRRIAEVKRLYVLPVSRGLGIGKELVKAILDVARRERYTEVLLHTLPHMVSAIKLYKSFGFVETGKYYGTTLEGTVFMRLVFDREGGSDP